MSLHEPNGKSLGVAYLLWFFLGYLGAHHFYLGKIGRGVGYFFTLGWLFIGWFIDLFTLPSQVRVINAMRRGPGVQQNVVFNVGQQPPPPAGPALPQGPATP